MWIDRRQGAKVQSLKVPGIRRCSEWVGVERGIPSSQKIFKKVFTVNVQCYVALVKGMIR